MNKLREIVFKSLVVNLGVAPELLSRVHSNEPIIIDLEGGSNIYVYFQKEILQTYIEMPLKDHKSLSIKASVFMEALANDGQLFMNIKDDKIILFSELGGDMANLAGRLSDKLDLFNKLACQLKV